MKPLPSGNGARSVVPSQNLPSVPLYSPEDIPSLYSPHPGDATHQYAYEVSPGTHWPADVITEAALVPAYTGNTRLVSPQRSFEWFSINMFSADLWTAPGTFNARTGSAGGYTFTGATNQIDAALDYAAILGIKLWVHCLTGIQSPAWWIGSTVPRGGSMINGSTGTYANCPQTNSQTPNVASPCPVWWHPEMYQSAAQNGGTIDGLFYGLFARLAALYESNPAFAGIVNPGPMTVFPEPMARDWTGTVTGAPSTRIQALTADGGAVDGAFNLVTFGSFLKGPAVAPVTPELAGSFVAITLTDSTGTHTYPYGLYRDSFGGLAAANEVLAHYYALKCLVPLFPTTWQQYACNPFASLIGTGTNVKYFDQSTGIFTPAQGNGPFATWSTGGGGFTFDGLGTTIDLMRAARMINGNVVLSNESARFVMIPGGPTGQAWTINPATGKLRIFDPNTYTNSPSQPGSKNVQYPHMFEALRRMGAPLFEQTASASTDPTGDRMGAGVPAWLISGLGVNMIETPSAYDPIWSGVLGTKRSDLTNPNNGSYDPAHAYHSGDFATGAGAIPYKISFTGGGTWIGNNQAPVVTDPAAAPTFWNSWPSGILPIGGSWTLAGNPVAPVQAGHAYVTGDHALSVFNKCYQAKSNFTTPVVMDDTDDPSQSNNWKASTDARIAWTSPYDPSWGWWQPYPQSRSAEFAPYGYQQQSQLMIANPTSGSGSNPPLIPMPVNAPATTTAYGTSIGVSTMSAMRSALLPNLWRTYTAGQRDSIPVTDAQALSYKPAGTDRDDLRGVNGNTAKTAVINKIAAYGNAVADLVGQYFLYYHEPDNDNVTGYPADYVTETSVVVGSVMPIINAGRTFPLGYITCLTGAPFLGGTAGNWLAAGVKIVGVDSYTNNAQLSSCASFAASAGISWCVPEFGYAATGSNPPDQATYLSHIQAAQAVWTGQTLKPLFVCIFNNFQSQFLPTLAPGAPSNSGPSDQIIAYWLGLDTASGTGPLVGTFSNVGSSAAVGFTLPNGLVAGQKIVVKVTYSGTGTVVITPPNAGWVALGPRLNAGNVDSSQLYQRTVVAGDSGATVSFGLSVSLRWAVGGVVASGLVVQSGAPVTSQDLSGTAAPAIPGWTPLADNAVAVAFVGARDATATDAVSFTPAVGWSEDIDRFTATGSPNVGAYVMHKQLGAGTAGVAQPATSIASVSGFQVTANEFVVVLVPPGGGPTSATDTVPLADAVLRGAQAQARTTSDAVPVAAAASRSSAAARATADLVPVGDVITRGSQTQARAAADSVPVADVGSTGGTVGRSTADTLPLADAVTRGAQVRARALADAIPVADVVTPSGNLQQQIHAPVSSAPSSGNSAGPSIVMPALAGGEGIFLDLAFDKASGVNVTTVPTLPSGPFVLLGSVTKAGQLTVATYFKVATAGDSGQTAAAVLSGAVKWDLLADAYQGANQAAGTHVYASAVESATTQTHTTPPVVITRPGSWVREVVADRGSPSSASYTAPGSQTPRSQNAGVGGTSSVSINSGDNGAPLAAGTYGSDVWTGQLSTSAAVMVSIGIAPASAGGGTAVAGDTIPLADSAARSQAVAARTAADSVPVAAVLARTATAATRALTAAFPGLSDVMARAQAQARSLADFLPIGDAASRGAAIAARVIADSAVISDAVARAQALKARTSSDAIPVADVARTTAGHSAAIADTVPLVDVATARSSRVHIVADTIALADAVGSRVAAAVRNLFEDVIDVEDVLTRFGVTAARSTIDDIDLVDFAAGPIISVPPPLQIAGVSSAWSAYLPTRIRWTAHT